MVHVQRLSAVDGGLCLSGCDNGYTWHGFCYVGLSCDFVIWEPLQVIDKSCSLLLFTSLWYYHGLYTVGKANSQSNGKGQISTPSYPENLERISMKLGIYNYIVLMSKHANPCGAATTWVVWAHTWLVACWFLSKLFLRYISAHIEPASVDRFWCSIHHMTCFYARKCPIGVTFILLPILGIIPPKNTFLGLNTHFQA